MMILYDKKKEHWYFLSFEGEMGREMGFSFLFIFFVNIPFISLFSFSFFLFILFLFATYEQI